MKTRLVRARTDRMIGGVCSGLAAYLGIDVVWVRLFFVLLAFAEGIGILVYVLLWIITPEGEPTALVAGSGEGVARGVSQQQVGLIAGVALIGLGAVLLLDNLNLFYWFSLGRLWPVLLIAGGIALLASRARRV